MMMMSEGLPGRSTSAVQPRSSVATVTATRSRPNNSPWRNYR